MATRSLNVVIAADNKGFRRAVNEVDRDADKLDRKLKVVTKAGSAFSHEMGGLTVRVGAFAGSLGTMIPTLVSVAPALTAAAAAATALAGSFAAAAGGAGALGVGLAASLAPVLVVGKQVTSRFEEIKKAYDAVKTAQREGTAESQKNAAAALATLSESERGMVAALERVSGLQKKVLGPASDRIIGALAAAITKLAPAVEKLAGPFTRLGGAIADSIGRAANVLSGSVWTGALKKFVDSARGLIGPITTVFISIAAIMRDVAVAALPLVQSAVKSVAGTFKDLNKEATRGRIAEIVGTLVEHTRSWWNLTKEVGKLLFQVFGSGAEQGKSLVDSLAGVVAKVNEFVAGMRNGEGAGGAFVDRVVIGFAKVKAVAEVVFPILRDGGTIALGLLEQGFGRLRAIIELVAPTFLKVKDAAVDAFGWLQTNAPPAFEAVKNVVVTVASAIAGALSTAFEAVKGVVSGAIEFIRGWIDKHRDDINAFGQAWKNIAKIVVTGVGVLVAGLKLAFENVLVPAMKVVLDVVKAVWPGIKMVIEGVLKAIGGVINVFSGIFTLDFKRTWEGIKDIFEGALKIILGLVRGAAEGLFAAAKGLGGMLKDGIVAGVKGLAGLLKDAIVTAVKWVAENVPGLLADAVKGIGGAIGKGITNALGIGDGLGGAIGDGIGKIVPAFGGGLQGANPALSPIAGIASRFGVRVSSGRRPGSITSSGNVSYHSSGEAVDLADGVQGPSAAKLGLFRYLKATWGSRLAELIYTPGGAGIKNGQSYTYTGKVAADHNDHVHAALDLGTPGVGIGDGEGNSPYSRMTRGWKNGPARPMSFDAVAALFESRGLPGVTFAQVAQGESGLDPDNIGHDRGGTQGLGLVQVTTGFNEDIIRKHGGPAAMLNPGPQADAAADVWKRQGKGAWRGTRFVKGWNLHYKGSTANVGGSSGGSGSKGGKTVTSTGTAPDGVPRPQPLPTTRTVQIRGTDGTMHTVRLPIGDEPLFQGPSFPSIKGQTQAQSDALEGRMSLLADVQSGGGGLESLLAAAPTAEDFALSDIARARLTPDTADDIAAATKLRDIRKLAMDKALDTPDPRDDATAIDAYLQAADAVKTLTEAVENESANTAALAAALKGVQDELKRQTDFATSVASTSNYQLTKTLSDLISGHIVGYGVAGRSFTPGAAVGHAY